MYNQKVYPFEFDVEINEEKVKWNLPYKTQNF
jgi:hypothetical protein